MNPSTTDVTIHATTPSGKKVTVKSFDVIIQNTGMLPHSGQPLIMFFVVDENGQHGIFNQNELTNYVEK
jgi:hypothetical protein